jgi:hypothetical protein
MKKTLIALAAVTAAAAAAPTSAFAWEQIGYQQADMKRDFDTVSVRGSERHKAIRICVEREALRMRDLKVNFANGGTQDVQVRQRFAPGSCTRVIDLKGQRRNITSVAMYYDKARRGPPAIVKVYAR